MQKLQSQLKKPLETDVRDLSDEFVLREISEIYVPIFEARLIGPKKKVGIIRIDSVRNNLILFFDIIQIQAGSKKFYCEI